MNTNPPSPNTDELRNELHRALGLESDDSLMNDEDHLDDLDSDGSHNDVENNEGDDDIDVEDDEVVEVLEIGEDREMGDDISQEDLAIGPLPGMKFKGSGHMYEFYKAHARLLGFCIVKRTCNKKGGDTVRYVQFVCDRARKPKHKISGKRMNCMARINEIFENDGSCRVSKVIRKHNHKLEPSLSRLMAGHRNVSNSLKRWFQANDLAGLRPSKNIRVAEVLAGGPENLGCTTKDCRNYIMNSRRFELQEGDAQALLRFFTDMQQKDREFFYSIDVDSVGRIRNVVWVHSHSKVAYDTFHDVICFDTTYLVNRYNMPFASFVGVNQHRQSVLLGCALLSNEDIASYLLVISTWLRAMGDVCPLAILTDQCESIKAAIHQLMPNTVQRYCVWHIFSKLPLRLSGVSDAKRAKSEFKAMVLESITTVEFENRWDEYIAKYNLNGREWFLKLYLEREKWVPAYLDDHFWAGMLSTQRSEGMHAFFDGFITRQSTLKQFVQQYELAIRDKFEKELEAEYRSNCFELKCLSEFPWEAQLQACYTREIFELFQQQLKKHMHCEISSFEDDEAEPGVEKFLITDYSKRSFSRSDPFLFTVRYTAVGEHLSCSCKWFESRGYLCCHILKVLSHKRIETVDQRYILDRWRKDIVRPHLKRFFLGGYPHMTSEYMMYKDLLKHFERNCDIALDSEVKRKYMKYMMIKIEHDLSNWNDEIIEQFVPLEELNEVDVYVDPVSVGEGDATILRNPRYTRSRGRPRLSRYRGRLETYFRSSQSGGRGGVSSRGGGRGSRVGGRGSRGGGRGGGRAGGRAGGRGSQGSQGINGQDEGNEQGGAPTSPLGSLPDLNDDIEDLTI